MGYYSTFQLNWTPDNPEVSEYIEKNQDTYYGIEPVMILMKVNFDDCNRKAH